MRYGSVCSGVEAATVAWEPLGWEPQWFSEIEKFPSAVLQHHYPNVPNFGDMTKFQEWPDDRTNGVDLIVGGPPCQDFSVAGLRAGMAGDRGNLTLTYLDLVAKYRPRWVVYENVPGLLSSNKGRDFGAFLSALGKRGYGYAWRSLDAQYFGLAQRRKRVFVVGCLGDWRRAGAVLFERESLSGHPAPSREAREETAKCLTAGIAQRYDSETETMICFEPRSPDGVPRISKDVCPTLNTMGGGQREPCVAFGINEQPDVAHCLRSGASKADKHESPTYVTNNAQVRRLTPVECERLQGFPDDFTKIPYRGKPVDKCPDGPRYKAMGNSMAVPVMKWIGERIEKINGSK